jgi:hypothetical protein
MKRTSDGESDSAIEIQHVALVRAVVDVPQVGS